MKFRKINISILKESTRCQKSNPSFQIKDSKKHLQQTIHFNLQFIFTVMYRVKYTFNDSSTYEWFCCLHSHTREVQIITNTNIDTLSVNPSNEQVIYQKLFLYVIIPLYNNNTSITLCYIFYIFILFFYNYFEIISN